MSTITFSRSSRDGVRYVRVLFNGMPVMADRVADAAGEQCAVAIAERSKRGLRKYIVNAWDGDTQQETILATVDGAP